MCSLKIIHTRGKLCMHEGTKFTKIFNGDVGFVRITIKFQSADLKCEERAKNDSSLNDV